MRIALISDIHGNEVAFDAVLADLETRAIDRVVCLGDVAAAGPQPAACVRRVRALGWPVVRGNTDDLLLNPPAAGAATDEAGRRRAAMLQWGANQLAAEDRAYLATLPPTIDVELGDGALLLCFHGSPRSYDDVILPTTADAEVERLLDERDAAVYTGGHTHVSMVRPFGTRLLVNPGSVGMTYFRVGGSIAASPPWAEYAILTWAAGLASVELCRVPVAREALLAAARASGMPNAETWVAGWS